MKCIYLSGPMTGHEDYNFPAFAAEAARLRALGYKVVSPHEFPNVGKPWAECLKYDLVAMIQEGCDSIALLPGWEDSRGARLEYHVAVNLGFISTPCHLIQEKAQ